MQPFYKNNMRIMVSNGVVQRLIANINQLINKQINTILHHQQFQQMEASWRSLENLCLEIAHCQNDAIQIKVLSLSFKECAQDLTIQHADFDRSECFKLIYTQEFDQPGGEPYSLLIADYAFHHGLIAGNDCVSTLAELSKIAASAFCPLITAVDAELVNIEHWGDLKPHLNLNKTLAEPSHYRWQQIRSLPESQFLALVAPRLLVRTRYQLSPYYHRNLFFQEDIDSHEDQLWGSSAYRYASAIIQSYHQTGWFLRIRQPLEAISCYQPDPGLIDGSFNIDKPQTECYISDQTEKQLNQLGIITPKQHKVSHHIAFYAQHSAHLPAHYQKQQANYNAYLSAQMPYLLCASRFSQTIKVILRDKVGRYTNAEECQIEMQKWLLTFCAAADGTTGETLARYPLSEAEVKIKSLPHQPGHYHCITQIKPHCLLAAIDSQLTLVSQIHLRSPQQERAHV